MIIWINGPFGVGKSTLATMLAPMIDSGMIMDPEVLGAYLHRFVPLSPTGDYQDLELWRSLTVHGITELRRIYDATVVVPMSLLNPNYIDSMLGALSTQGETLLHVFLDTSDTALIRRIEAHSIDDDPEVNAGVRQRRLSHLAEAKAARSCMPESTLWLDATTRSPHQLAAQVLEQLSGDATCT